MVKLFFWRFSLELLCFIKWLSRNKGPRVKNFAFGANLHQETLKQRKITVFSEEFLVLEDYELCFDHKGPFVGQAFASINPTVGSSVLGKVYEMSIWDGWRLDCFEACLFLRRYIRKYMALDGKVFYYYQTNRPVQGLRPTQEYKDKILSGYGPYKDSYPDHYESLAKVEVVDELQFDREANFTVLDYNILGKGISPLLRWYDYTCLRIAMLLYNIPTIF